MDKKDGDKRQEPNPEAGDAQDSKQESSPEGESAAGTYDARPDPYIPPGSSTQRPRPPLPSGGPPVERGNELNFSSLPPTPPSRAGPSSSASHSQQLPSPALPTAPHGSAGAGYWSQPQPQSRFAPGEDARGDIFDEYQPGSSSDSDTRGNSLYEEVETTLDAMASLLEAACNIVSNLPPVGIPANDKAAKQGRSGEKTKKRPLPSRGGHRNPLQRQPPTASRPAESEQVPSRVGTLRGQGGARRGEERTSRGQAGGQREGGQGQQQGRPSNWRKSDSNRIISSFDQKGTPQANQVFIRETPPGIYLIAIGQNHRHFVNRAIGVIEQTERSSEELGAQLAVTRRSMESSSDNEMSPERQDEPEDEAEAEAEADRRPDPPEPAVDRNLRMFLLRLATDAFREWALAGLLFFFYPFVVFWRCLLPFWRILWSLWSRWH